MQGKSITFDASDVDTLEGAAEHLRHLGLTPPPAGNRPQDIPDATVEELMTLRTAARLAAEDFGTAVKAQAEKFSCRPGALRRYVTAKEAAKLADLDAEAEDLAKLMMRDEPHAEGDSDEC